MRAPQGGDGGAARACIGRRCCGTYGPFAAETARGPATCVCFCLSTMAGGFGSGGGGGGGGGGARG
jgi:hypothetical protein